MSAHVIHPRLDPQVDTAELPGGAVLLRHPDHGTQFALDVKDLPVVRAMDGSRSLEALEKLAMQALGSEEGAGALGYQALVMTLFQLWDRGMLADEDEVRDALFPHHKTRTLDRAKAKRWLSMVGDIKIFSAAGADVLRWAGVLGRALTSTPALGLAFGLGAAGLALLAAGVVAWPGHLLRLDGSFEAGIPLLYVTAALAMSMRGFVRAAVLAAEGHGPGLHTAGIRIAGGIVHVDVEDTAIYHVGPDLQRRFALAGLAAPLALGGGGAVASLAGLGGPAAVLASVTCYLVAFLDLSPFMQTDGARLVELGFSVPKQRFRVRTYVQRRLVRGLFGKQSKAAGAMAMVAVVWSFWFFAAFRILSDVLLEDFVQLVAKLFTTRSGLLLALGIPVLTALTVLALVMLGALAWVTLQSVLQVLTSGEARGQAQTHEKADPAELAQRLKELPLATALSDAARHALAERAVVTSYRGGEWIHRAADTEDQIAWVLTGRVELLRPLPEGGHQLVAVLGEGRQFGAEALTGGDRDLDVRAECEVRLAVMDADALRHALTEGEGDLDRALELARFLDGVPELAGLGPSARLDVAMQATVRDAEAGEAVINQGDPARALFLVRSGVCVATRTDSRGAAVELGRIAPGEAFGEIGLLLKRPRTATVTCAEPATLVELPAEVLDAALRRSFHVGLALERLATARLATVTDDPEVAA